MRDLCIEITPKMGLHMHRQKASTVLSSGEHARDCDINNVCGAMPVCQHNTRSRVAAGKAAGLGAGQGAGQVIG